jgi:hypothetical protein
LNDFFSVSVIVWYLSNSFHDFSSTVSTFALV